MTMFSGAVRGALILGIWSISVHADGQQTATELFRAVDSSPTGAPEAGVERARRVAVDLAQLGAVGVGDRLQFNFFEDQAFDTIFEKQYELEEGRTGWTGSVAGSSHGDFSLVFSPGLIIGNVRAPSGKLYRVRFIEPGVHEVQEVDVGLLPRCGTDHEHEVSLPGGDDGGSTSRNDDGTVFDVMVVYTAKAKNAAGGNQAISAVIDLAIIETNQAYENSQINSRVRLAYKGRVAYGEAGDFGSHLSALQNPSDGTIDSIHDIRDAVGADLVSMLVADGQYCGIGYLMTTLSSGFAAWAFSVTNWGCATGNYTFGHELGHNQGCAHDPDNAGSALYSYSYGHRFYGNGGGQYRTVMAYSPGSRIRQFSNPNVNFDGTPTGLSSRDNARSINNAALTISQWRSTRNELTGMLFSTRGGGTIGGLPITSGDVVQLDLATGTYSMMLDMGDVAPESANVDGVAAQTDGSFLLSFAADTTLVGLIGGPEGDTVRDEDLVRFVPTSVGSNTTGSFEFYFDGSDVGAGDNGEDVDALSTDDAGRLYVSTRGEAFLDGGVTGKDEDIYRFTPSSLGSTTTGTWVLHFDGSDMKMSGGGEDVDGHHRHESTGDLTVSTKGPFRVSPTLVGQDNDLITMLPDSLGDTTAGLFMHTLEGGFWGFGSLDIDAFHIVE